MKDLNSRIIGLTASQKRGLLRKLEAKKSYYALPSELRPDTIINEAIVFNSHNYLPTTPGHIFLTGATGILGPYLLQQLLLNSQSTIFCLVRSESDEHALCRIRSEMQSKGIWQEQFVSKIIAVKGDLSLPGFGISHKRYMELTRKVDVIYHNGAVVNWVLPYQAVKDVNVNGTKEILALAGSQSQKPKPVFFTSSIQVHPYAGNMNIYEDESLDHGKPLYGSNAQSKWVSEKLMINACLIGLPVTIFRPGPIGGPIGGGMYSGSLDPNSFIFKMLKGCIQAGIFPKIPSYIDIVPVDCVAKAYVKLSLGCLPESKVFNITNPRPLTADTVEKWFEDSGFALEYLPYLRWKARLIEVISGYQRSNELLPFLEFIKNQNEENLIFPKYRCDNTLNGYPEYSDICPPVSELLTTYFNKKVTRYA